MTLTRLRRPRRLAGSNRSNGQSLVEFALVLPILLILVMAIVDFARLYTTMLTVESAAREAADFGAFTWDNWIPANASTTATEMERRACVAVSNLPDAEGVCADPAFFDFSVDPPPGAPGMDCTVKPPAGVDPCRVTVTLAYQFHLFAPISVELFDVHLGLPSTLSFTRDSVFAISDFEIGS